MDWDGLEMACHRGHHEVVEILITKGQMDIDSRDNDGLTPLMISCLHGHLLVVKKLIEKGVNVNHPNQYAHEQQPKSYSPTSNPG